MLRHGLKRPVNRALARARAADPVTRWGIDHGLRVSGSDTPFDYFNWAKGMTTRDISHLVKQDCLLLVAKDDHLVPYDQFPAQVQTLTNARSLTCPRFHCGRTCKPTLPRWQSKAREAGHGRLVTGTHRYALVVLSDWASPGKGDRRSAFKRPVPPLMPIPTIFIEKIKD